MRIDIPKSLNELADIFAPFAPLYVVGGAVRNSLLGFPINDFDIAAKLSVDEVEGLLQNTNFHLSGKYKRTGTLVIKCGKQTFEYTTFRQDSYPLSSGEHTPSQCIFTDSIEVDAKRRDFSCNALYYDIKEHKIIDLVNGINDIQNKVLRTVRTPAQTLSEDALRIMRLVRFAVQLGFGIEADTLAAAKKYAKQLADISAERIKDELMATFEGPFKYGSERFGVKPSDGIRLLTDIGAMQYIIPEVLDMQGVAQNPKYHVFDVYNHTLQVIDCLPPRLAMAGLLHDIAKPVMLKQYGNMYMHELTGEEMTEQIMSRLKFSKKQIERTSRLVKMHMFDMDGKTRVSKCRIFIADNFEYFDDFIALKRADGYATNPNNYSDILVRKLIDIKNDMVEKALPIAISDLPIGGKDLQNLGYEGREIGDMLGKIRHWILCNGELPSRQKIIEKLRR